ncbi:hypothetical protein GJ496_003740, partial [Pomphorhynchus laevis]
MSFAPMPREFERLKLVDSLRYMSTSMFHNKYTPDVLEARRRFLSSSNIQKYVSMCPNHRAEQNMKKENRLALLNLRNNNEIIILPADKGSKTVVMDRKSYIEEGIRQLKSHVYREADENDFKAMTTTVLNTIKNHVRDEKLPQSLAVSDPIPGH